MSAASHAYKIPLPAGFSPHFLPSLPFCLSFLAIPFITMNQLLSFFLFLATTSWPVSASGKVIGPRADLEIVNAQIAPDGFKRSFVSHSFRRADVLTNNPSTVLAGGIFPGPLIRGNKVGVISKKGHRIF